MGFAPLERQHALVDPCRLTALLPAQIHQHESPALTFTEAGRTKTLTLSAREVAEVAAAVERYQTARAELDAQADSGLARLRSRGAKGGSP